MGLVNRKTTRTSISVVSPRVNAKPRTSPWEMMYSSRAARNDTVSDTRIVRLACPQRGRTREVWEVLEGQWRAAVLQPVRQCVGRALVETAGAAVDLALSGDLALHLGRRALQLTVQHDRKQVER